jgi:hypothetical protein
MSFWDRLAGVFRPKPLDEVPAKPEMPVVPVGPMTQGVPPVAPVNPPVDELPPPEE